ncbi:Hypothetical protein PACV_314 [Pacmanvirus A23]|uniref:Hypothetical protein n=1 Tax=Pacmanvirus A23 TaxID=1932881 RepID=UPI000A095D23|nr:Hypothetical protein B9W72_gp310 [Pacmanvirus A23]SIP86027.1 Hypothetical protein PACV_314 [Pacmanvirus A23]
MENEVDIKIRARRSKKVKNEPVQLQTIINPFIEHTLENDLSQIEYHAELFEKLDNNEKEVLYALVFDNKTLDYYYGSYITTYQLFTIAQQNNNNLAITLNSFIQVISARIINIIRRNREEN